jgi:hypothetical protein
VAEPERKRRWPLLVSIGSAAIAMLGLVADLTGIYSFTTGLNLPQTAHGDKGEQAISGPAKPDGSHGPAQPTGGSGPTASTTPVTGSNPTAKQPENKATTAAAKSTIAAPAAANENAKTTRQPVTLVSFTCERNPPNAQGIYIQYDISGIDGDTARVTVRINGDANTDDLTWPTPGTPDNVLHGSWGVLSDETTAHAGTCDLDASTTTGPIHASKQSN